MASTTSLQLLPRRSARPSDGHRWGRRTASRAQRPHTGGGPNYGPGAPGVVRRLPQTDGSIAEKCAVTASEGVCQVSRRRRSRLPRELEVLTRGGVTGSTCTRRATSRWTWADPFVTGIPRMSACGWGHTEGVGGTEGWGCNPHRRGAGRSGFATGVELPRRLGVAPAVMYPDGVNVEFVEFAEEEPRPAT